MRSSRDEFDLRIGFSFLDSPAISIVGPRAFTVYLKLRRYVWRSRKPNKLTSFFAKGLLVSKVNQGDVADQLGISRRSMVDDIDTLRRNGWIKTEKLDDYELVYVLGRKVDGLEHYFVDEQIQAYVDWLGDDLETEPCEDEKKARMIQIFRGPPAQTTHNPCAGPAQPLSESVTPRVQTAHNIMKVEKSEVGEVKSENLNAGAASQPPPSFLGESGFEEAAEDEEVDSDVVDGTRRAVEGAIAQSIALTASAHQEKVEKRKHVGALNALEASRAETPKTKTKKSKPKKEAAVNARPRWTQEMLSVEDAFRRAMQEEYRGLDVPTWDTDKERVQLEGLLEKYRVDLVKTGVVFAVKNWKSLCAKLGIHGPPTLGVFVSGYGNTIFAEAQGFSFGVTVKEEQKTGRLRGEFDKESADDSPDVGWGDEK